MRIIYLCLRNFSAIKYAMNTNEIEIDFGKMVNNLCLFIGPNGSGKTTVLSMMHPFATLGNLDIRDRNDLILEGVEGYKEIRILNGDDLYTIKHFYSPHDKKSHSIKSYIMKNDTELNPNGNVSSFKEYVKIELGVEMGHLKLIRLGSNVTSFIDLSDTERKAYMGKLLDDVDIYLVLYKKVNGDLIKLKDMISHDVDKMNRLGIVDKNNAKEEIKKLEKSLADNQNKYGDLSGDLSVHKHKLEEINTTESNERFNVLYKKFNKMNSSLKKRKSGDNPDIYRKRCEKIRNKINKIEIEIKSNEVRIQSYLDTLNDVNDELRNVTIEYNNKADSSSELSHMKSELKNIENQMEELSENIGEIPKDLSYSKEEFDEFISSLKKLQETLQLQVYSCEKEEVDKIIDMIRNNENVIHYINSNIIEFDEETETNIFLKDLSTRFNFEDTFFSNCSNNECNARRLWLQIGNLLRSRNNERKTHSLEYYKRLESIYNVICYSIETLGKYSNIIEKLPKDIRNSFKMKNLLSNISLYKSIYDEKIFNQMLSVVTDIYLYKDLLNKYNDLIHNIDLLGQVLDLKYFENRIDTLRSKSSDIQKNLKSIRTNNENLNSNLITMKDYYEETSDMLIALEEYENVGRELKELNEKILEGNRLMTLIEKESFSINQCRKDIKDLEEAIQKKRTSLAEFKSINKELKIYREVYDDMVYVKDALSTKKGVPIYIIKRYLDDVVTITNELLDIAYNGEKYLDNFDISANGFGIPWFNKGKRISDVRYASDGEISFLTTSLSFGLSATQISKKYNIMLSDETDGPLDISSREKFIKIYENYMNRIKAEQSFLITHNDMFRSYPVDVINFGDDNYEKMNFELANFINIIKK